MARPTLQQADKASKRSHRENTDTSSARVQRRPRPNAYRGSKSLKGAEQPQLHPVRSLLPATSAAHTFPYIEVRNTTSPPSTSGTSKIGEDQMFYCRPRDQPRTPEMIVNGSAGRVP